MRSSPRWRSGSARSWPGGPSSWAGSGTAAGAWWLPARTRRGGSGSAPPCPSGRRCGCARTGCSWRGAWSCTGKSPGASSRCCTASAPTWNRCRWTRPTWTSRGTSLVSAAPRLWGGPSSRPCGKRKTCRAPWGSGPTSSWPSWPRSWPSPTGCGCFPLPTRTSCFRPCPCASCPGWASARPAACRRWGWPRWPTSGPAAARNWPARWGGRGSGCGSWRGASTPGRWRRARRPVPSAPSRRLRRTWKTPTGGGGSWPCSPARWPGGCGRRGCGPAASLSRPATRTSSPSPAAPRCPRPRPTTGCCTRRRAGFCAGFRRGPAGYGCWAWPRASSPVFPKGNCGRRTRAPAPGRYARRRWLG